MISGRLVFVDVDTQHDFLHPSGTLFIPGSSAILTNLARLTKWAREHKIPVLATACAHTLDEDDPEPFPPHCLVGTLGQRRIPETDWPGGIVMPLAVGMDTLLSIPDHLTVEKNRYDVFSRPDADAMVEFYGREDPTFVVYGVATDYCVKATVMGLLDRGKSVAVVVDAIHAIDVDHESEILRQFVEAGAQLVTTEDVTQD